jgi:hypothetical protein
MDGSETITVTAADVLGRWAESPPYDAVTVRAPAVGGVITPIVAVPFDRVAVAIGVDPSSSVTVPVGVVRLGPLGTEATVTVNVTVRPAGTVVGTAVSVVTVGTGSTCTLTGADVLPWKDASPEYEAVIGWTPVEVVRTMVAVPFDPSGADPIAFPLLPKNVTVPVGVSPVAVDDGVTVAVSVIGWKKRPGFGSAVRVIAVGIWFTCWATGPDVLVWKDTSPEYEAVIVWAPATRFDTVRAATPFEATGADPIGVVPSKNVTVPVGTSPVVADGVTVAVNVTGWPTRVGFGAAASAVVVGIWFTCWVTAPELAW